MERKEPGLGDMETALLTNGGELSEIKNDPYATPESLCYAQLGIESKDKTSWTKTNLAHPGKRYQGQAIDGIVTLAIFAGTLFGVKYLTLDGDL